MQRTQFNSTSNMHGAPGYPERSGEIVEVLRPLSASECDEREVGRMFRVQFQDGVQADAFEDELTTIEESQAG